MGDSQRSESSKPLIEIREEQPRDTAAIRDVNCRAFGQEQEANIVDALRANGAMLLSLVAVLGERLVGHIVYSPVVVASVTGAALGPMAVRPEYQRQGIGSRLIEAGNRRLAESGCPFIVVVGHSDYYPRFGFRLARDYAITCQWEVPDEVFRVIVFDQARMRQVSGLARYRDEFSTVI
jgi:putative acetyltransferase